MRAVFIGSLLVPGEGEEAGLARVEQRAATAAERAIIAKLTAEAEELYPKLAGKIQGHHEIPKYLGGAAKGQLRRLNGA
jgi:hypothetical protein